MPADSVGFRHLWGQAKPAELIATAESEPNALYEQVEPVLPLGLPFVRATVSPDWFAWPTLPELFPAWFQGSETGRDAFLIDIDLDRLKERVADYFDPQVSHEEMARRHPVVMKDTARFDARGVRNTLIGRGGPDEAGFVRHAYRPFDDRWLYWEGETKLLREKSPRYPTHVIKGNLWVAAARHLRRGADEPQACFTRHLASRHLIERGTSMFPAWLRDDVLQVGTGENGEIPRRPNLSAGARRYLQRLGLVLMIVLSCCCYSARGDVPQSKRWWVAGGLAAHSAARLAGRRCKRGGGPTCTVCGARAGIGRTIR